MESIPFPVSLYRRRHLFRRHRHKIRSTAGTRKRAHRNRLIRKRPWMPEGLQSDAFDDGVALRKKLAEIAEYGCGVFLDKPTHVTLDGKITEAGRRFRLLMMDSCLALAHRLWRFVEGGSCLLYWRIPRCSCRKTSGYSNKAESELIHPLPDSMRLRRGERLISRGYRQHALKGDFRDPWSVTVKANLRVIFRLNRAPPDLYGRTQSLGCVRH